jgi:hypothetical protein
MAKADGTSSTPADPIYAAIERHKNAARLWAAAVKVRDASFKDAANPVDLDQQHQLDAAVANARLPLIDAGLDLIETAPTTPPQGLVAALEYARDQLDGGDDAMPQEVAWLDVFVDTLANAAGDLLRTYPGEEES